MKISERANVIMKLKRVVLLIIAFGIITAEVAITTTPAIHAILNHIVVFHRINIFLPNVLKNISNFVTLYTSNNKFDKITSVPTEVNSTKKRTLRLLRNEIYNRTQYALVKSNG